MQSTRAAQGVRMPMPHAANRNGRASRSLSGRDTTRNGNSESSSGPLQRVNPSRRAAAQTSGTANGRIPAASASKNKPI